MPRKKKLFASDAASLEEPFGSTLHSAACGQVHSMTLEGTRKEVRVRLRGRMCASPGVYGFIDRAGELVYVGMSRNLRHRVQSYFASNGRKKKEARIGRKGVQLLWQPAVHPLIARLRELELIRRFHPAYNVEGHPWRMREGYVVLVAHEAPWFRLVSSLPAQLGGLWGPIPINRATQAAVQELNRFFRLRDCPVSTPLAFAGESPLFPAHAPAGCLRAETQSCLAPCIGACGRQDYANSIRQARKFLDGQDMDVLTRLESAMKEASLQQKFEKALRLRDARGALERLDQHLRRFHDWREQATFVYPVQDAGPVGERWILIVRGVVHQVLPPPLEAQSKSQAHAALQAVIERPYVDHTDLSENQFQSARVVHAWFRKYPEEKDRRLTLKQALARCRSRKRA